MITVKKKIPDKSPRLPPCPSRSLLGLGNLSGHGLDAAEPLADGIGEGLS
jgi:hypothetical protein